MTGAACYHGRAIGHEGRGMMRRLLLAAATVVVLTSPAHALTLSCHLGQDNVVISLDPDDGSAFEHTRAWKGHFTVSEGTYRIWLDANFPRPPEGYFLDNADLYLEIDRYSGRANAHWGSGKGFSGNSQNCRIVDKQLF